MCWIDLNLVDLILYELMVFAIIDQAVLLRYYLFIYFLGLLDWVLDSDWSLPFGLLLRDLPIDAYVASRGGSLVHLHVVDLDLPDVAATHFSLFSPLNDLSLVCLLLDVHHVPPLLMIFNRR